ncbi:DegV family protein [Fructilactobacillus cliffordii]|uniref:DegV family protein n=1 Tax=Fructilactobacillus cliffordii TaxID=2940299 RepID=UPI002091EB98|nr:DegV family protein [Fructilactobacillus cliffordii]USS85886.1 DegV family protein [Fructilactobacillus cliffordii]
MIHIVTDSTAQLTPEEIKDNDLHVIPLQVSFEGKTYQDNVDITRQQFSEMLHDDETEFPKTSQPAMGQFVETYEQILKDDPDGSIVSIHITRILSGTVETAQSAAQQVNGDIRVIDSKSTDRGLGFEVLKAAELAKAGKSAEEVENGVIAMIPEISLHVFVNSFDYLVKGGRASRAVGFISSLIQLKPVLALNDGKLEIVAKCRGAKKMRKVRDEITETLINDPTVKEVGLSYVDSTEDVDAVVARIKEARPDINVLVRLTCPVIMTHVGPGGFAIIYN